MKRNDRIGNRGDLSLKEQEEREKDMYQILKAEKLADKIYLMDVKAPRVACACEPGEFVIVKMDEEGERIPLTICDFNREDG